jgi:GT2 family glycosyltransferase
VIERPADKLGNSIKMRIIATVAVPTLLADSSLEACIAALRNQTRTDFEIIIIDNSGQGRARKLFSEAVRIISNPGNVGFGAAINRAFEQSSAPYLLTLNDDAVPCPGWVAAIIAAAESDSRVGMCASQVRLDHDALDSAGMLLYGDGSSKQRGHGENPAEYSCQEEVLFPSASAALYRRTMLDRIGLFDENFFLYCEDTDLGLRARTAGWRCLYVPGARVHHLYSHSAGRVSPVKAYYVERNRMLVAMKNLPVRMLLALPFREITRYLEHFRAAHSGTGKSAQFRLEGGGVGQMALIVLKAHFAACLAVMRILGQRRAIRKTAVLSSAEFTSLLQTHSATASEIARH